jgi:pimeloyl-ACP methyl ester carboxylesterase
LHPASPNPIGTCFSPWTGFIFASKIRDDVDSGRVAAFAKVMKHMTNPLTHQSYNVLRRLKYIKAPTLIVWGSDDKVNGQSHGESLRDGIAGARLTVFEGPAMRFHRNVQWSSARRCWNFWVESEERR